MIAARERRTRGFLIGLCRLEATLFRLVEASAVLLLAGAAVTGCAQVVARTLLHQPTTWSTSLTQLLVNWAIFLGVAMAVRQGSLLAVDSARLVPGQALQRALRILASAGTAVFLGLVLWHGVALAWRVRHQTMAALDLAQSWAYAAIPVGAALGLLGLGVRLLRPFEGPCQCALACRIVTETMTDYREGEEPRR